MCFNVKVLLFEWSQTRLNKWILILLVTKLVRSTLLASLNQLKSAWINISLNPLSHVGSPWCHALPHYVCPEHGAHPVPALAPQPRRTGAGPCAPAAPRCQRWRARQLRGTNSGLNINCGDKQEAVHRNNLHMEMHGGKTIQYKSIPFF